MPFTASHPAAVLPLAYLPRKYICMTGLIVGSVSPDFEYFFLMGNGSRFGHTASGLFYFCLPVGLLLCFIFHDIVRDVFIDSLPRFLKARFSRIKQFDWNKHFVKRWFVVIPSILAGAWTHVFWDSFTHDAFSMYQHPSTAAGAAVIIITTLKMPKDKTVTSGINIKYWGVGAAVFAAVTATCFLTIRRNDFIEILANGFDTNLYYVVRAGTSLISAALIAVTVTSLGWKLWPALKSIFFDFNANHNLS